MLTPAAVGRTLIDGAAESERFSYAGVTRFHSALGDPRVLGRFFRRDFLQSFADRVRIGVLRHEHLNFVPQPLARRGKIEVVALDREAVDERNLSAGRMARVGPISGLENHRVQQSDL